MKHFFFINPAAGRGDRTDSLAAEIEATLKASGEEYRILFTDAVGHGSVLAREAAESLEGQEGRFYACGGDGTVNEIVNGMVGFPNVALGIIPIGSGNDTVRNFRDCGDFLSVKSQIRGEDSPIDLIRVDGDLDGTQQSRYCVNMINIGFDSNVVENAANLKRKPLVTGTGAYALSVLGMLIQKKGTSLVVKQGEEILQEGDLLLCTMANGSYCGGGYCGAPQATMDDGYFDLNLVGDLPRRQFLKLLPKYKEGTHLEDPACQQLIRPYRCKELSVVPYGGDPIHFCIDGEIFVTEGFRLALCEHAIRFIRPAL